MSGQIEYRAPEQRWVYVIDDKQVKGELNYQVLGDAHWHIHHTGVDESLQGQGIARLLVDAADDYARAHGIKLTSSCSYASHVLARKHA